MIETLLKALDVMQQVPAARSAISAVGLNFQKLSTDRDYEELAFRGGLDPRRFLLEMVIDKEEQRIKDLINQYYEIYNREEYDTIEKDQCRKRIAIQTCKALQACEPIREYFSEYDKLVELFCKSFIRVLTESR